MNEGWSTDVSALLSLYYLSFRHNRNTAQKKLVNDLNKQDHQQAIATSYEVLRV